MSKAGKTFLIFFLAGIIGFVILLSFKQSAQVNNIKYVTAKYRDIKNIRLVSGVLVPKEKVELKSKISGILEKLYVTPGQQVEKGQAIARVRLLSDPKSVALAEKQLEIANINRKSSTTKYKRNKQLFNEGVISKSQFEAYEKDYLLAKEDVASARKELQITKNGFSGKSAMYNIVYSTISGIVLDVPLKEGSSVIESNTFNQGSTIATVADIHEVEFKAEVAEKDIQYLKIGQVFQITVNALNNKKFKARLTNVSSSAKEENGIAKFGIEGKVLLPEDQKVITRSGYTAVGKIVLEEAKHVLAINENLVTFSGDSAFVFIESKGRKIKRSIETGISDGIHVQVVKGIDAKDKIIEQQDI